MEVRDKISVEVKIQDIQAVTTHLISGVTGLYRMLWEHGGGTLALG